MRFNSLAISVLLLCCALPAAAGDKDGLRDFDFIKETTPCLNLSNPAALSAWNGKISKASVMLDKEDGPLVSLIQSKDSYEAVAGTESFVRISNKTAFHGNISWGYFNGKDMGGQILIDPYYNPVNFLESDPATIGTKQRESYSLKGDMSHTFNSRWAAGIGVKFDCKDQTKIKDPRFMTYWTDLRLDAGVSFSPSDGLMLGASLFYRNTLEQIQGGIYGQIDKQYFVQTDKGGFLGTVSELVGDRNHMSLMSRRPMDNSFFGGALQVTSGDRLASEVSFAYRTGYYGRKSTSTAVFYEFSGIEVRYDGSYLIPSGNNLHRISLSAGYTTLGNNENKFNYVTPLGGVTEVQYTGASHILDRSVIDGVLGYRWYRNTDGGRPEFTLGADFAFYSRFQHTDLFPIYRNSDFTRVDADIFCSRDFRMKKSIITPEIHALGRYGFGTDKEDGVTVAGGSSAKSFDYWLGRDFEFETAPRYGAAAGVTFTIITAKGIAPYVKVTDSFMSLVAEPAHLDGRIRNVAAITFGCTF